MDLLDLKIYPDDMLRQKCEVMEEFSLAEEEFFEKMLLTMHHCGGIGLAAPQVGSLKRLIVADIGDGPVKLVNPQIVETHGTDRMREGCLSIPNVQIEVERPLEIVVRGLSKKGKSIEFEFEGLMAKVIQHEIDHLDGKLIVDYLDTFEAVKFYSAKVAEEANGNENTF